MRIGCVGFLVAVLGSPSYSDDWPQFRGIADILLTGEARPLIMDGRRMLQHKYDDLQKAGFSIIAVGSPFLKAKN
jgi:hypothetical protein